VVTDAVRCMSPIGEPELKWCEVLIPLDPAAGRVGSHSGYLRTPPGSYSFVTDLPSSQSSDPQRLQIVRGLMSYIRLPGCASEPRNRIAVSSLVVPFLGTVPFDYLLARHSYCDLSSGFVRFETRARIPSCRQADS
jgi:hypothetical protein